MTGYDSINETVESRWKRTKVLPISDERLNGIETAPSTQSTQSTQSIVKVMNERVPRYRLITDLQVSIVISKLKRRVSCLLVTSFSN